MDGFYIPKMQNLDYGDTQKSLKIIENYLRLLAEQIEIGLMSENEINKGGKDNG